MMVMVNPMTMNSLQKAQYGDLEKMEQEIQELEEQLEETQDSQEKKEIKSQLEALRQTHAAAKMLTLASKFQGGEFKIYGVISSGLYIITDLVLLTGGMGLILLASWGRKLTLFASGCKILLAFLNAVFLVFWLMPKYKEMFQEMTDIIPEMSRSASAGSPGPTQIMEIMSQMMDVFGVFGAILMFIIYSIFPILIILLLNFKDVKRLLAGQWPQESLENEFDINPEHLEEDTR